MYRIISFSFVWMLSLFAYLQAGIDGKAALQLLIEGNQRFKESSSLHPNRTEELRHAIATKQEPFAIVLGCSDSRVSPEILFDQGIGDLFTVRVAGNVAGPIEIASIEYAALYLHSSLIVVLGHENCGAVSAVLEGNTQGIEPIASLINPVVKKIAKTGKNRLENAVKENVVSVVNQLQNHPMLKPLVDKQSLLVVGGYYSFMSGKVEFFP